MATLANLADELELPVDEYLDWVVNLYINWNKKEFIKDFAEVCACWWYEDFMDNLWNFWPETQMKILKAIVEFTYNS